MAIETIDLNIPVVSGRNPGSVSAVARAKSAVKKSEAAGHGLPKVENPAGVNAHPA